MTTLKTLFHATLIITLLIFSSTTIAAEHCNRACLTQIIDHYFDALVANSPEGLPLATQAKITLNSKIVRLHDTFWNNAQKVGYRWDAVNERLGDTGTEAIVENSDGSRTVLALRLKISNGAITEVEMIKANKGDAGEFLWDPARLLDNPVSADLLLNIPERERDSYYQLIASAEGYWRAFQTNGHDNYHPAALLPTAKRFENGRQTTGLVRDGAFVTAAQGFDNGRFPARNLWDRRYAVVDQERGIVMSIVRFGLKDGMQSQSTATQNDRLVAEFFAIQTGMIKEIHAVLFNMADSEPTNWEPDYGPGRGGW